jgi:23S rRNA (cytosine1962-C5)-methyltransferase
MGAIARAVLKTKEERRLLRGHLWAYRNEFATLPQSLEDGDLADVYSHDGKLVGRGFYQAEGGIAVRLLSRRAQEVEVDFFRERIEAALRLRERFFPGNRVYRWVHGESDGLPGLVADRFETVVSVRTSCGFYERFAQNLVEIFKGFDGVDGVLFEDRKNAHREFGQVPDELEVTLDGVRLGFALSAGQKTGLFLDQRENCRLLDRVAPGARVFDGHCYIGQWSCRALRAGAASVLAADTSQRAIDWARHNVALNGGSDRCQFECAPVERLLKSAGRFDGVCLDPPALAKGRLSVGKALELYQALNRDGMKAVVPGGFLISSSCSQPVDMALFLEMLKRAARSAQRQVTILELRGAPLDHPVLMEMPETSYLTCALLQIH